MLRPSKAPAREAPPLRRARPLGGPAPRLARGVTRFQHWDQGLWLYPTRPSSLPSWLLLQSHHQRPPLRAVHFDGATGQRSQSHPAMRPMTLAPPSRLRGIFRQTSDCPLTLRSGPRNCPAVSAEWWDVTCTEYILEYHFFVFPTVPCQSEPSP